MKGHGLAHPFLSGGIRHDEMDLHRKPGPAVAGQIDLGRVLDFLHAWRGQRDRHTVFLVGGGRMRILEADRELRFHDAVIVIRGPGELRPVETAIGREWTQIPPWADRPAMPAAAKRPARPTSARRHGRLPAAIALASHAPSGVAANFFELLWRPFRMRRGAVGASVRKRDL
jgi:hypothetical protein